MPSYIVLVLAGGERQAGVTLECADIEPLRFGVEVSAEDGDGHTIDSMQLVLFEPLEGQGALYMVAAAKRWRHDNWLTNVPKEVNDVSVDRKTGQILDAASLADRDVSLEKSAV